MNNRNETRDPIAAWPIIDGPMKGNNHAWPTDFFYVAEVATSKVAQLEAPARLADSTPRTEYRLMPAPGGGFVWSCAMPSASKGEP